MRAINDFKVPKVIFQFTTCNKHSSAAAWKLYNFKPFFLRQFFFQYLVVYEVPDTLETCRQHFMLSINKLMTSLSVSISFPMVFPKSVFLEMAFAITCSTVKRGAMKLNYARSFDPALSIEKPGHGFI